MTKSKRTFGLFQTEVKALNFLSEDRPDHKATAEDIYVMSCSRGHPKYVIDSLSKRGLIEETDPSRVHSDWKLTVDGYKKLEEYRRNKAKIGELNID